MNRSKWFFGLLALTAALTLGGADLASAQYYGGGRGPGGGRGVCLQTTQSQTGSTTFRQGQGQRQGQRQRLQRRDGSCLNTAAPNTPAAPVGPAPSN